MIVIPFLQTPFTEILGSFHTHQHFGGCADMEMRVLNCFEAYGYRKGQIKCEDLIADFNECALKTKQFARVTEMREERRRQLQAGERTKQEMFAAPPNPDSFQ